MARKRGTARTPFGDTLRRHRLLAGLSQAALARRAGISPSLVALLELGLRQPRRDKVLVLARGLALGPAKRNDFLRDGGLAPISTEPRPDQDTLERAIADLLADPRLSPKQRLVAEALVEAFARWLRAELANDRLNLRIQR
jgi:transcriptional regulator with XRE-family HTH domain